MPVVSCVMSSITGTRKHVFCMHRIVSIRYRNLLHVCQPFGAIRIRVCSLGRAEPLIFTVSMDMCRALASTAALTRSLS